jgi:hypothetical protein
MCRKEKSGPRRFLAALRVADLAGPSPYNGGLRVARALAGRGRCDLLKVPGEDLLNGALPASGAGKTDVGSWPTDCGRDIDRE